MQEINCTDSNYWMSSFRLTDKEKQEDGRYKKVYEKEPKTPYERLMKSPDISSQCKAKLERRRAVRYPLPDFG